MKMVKVKVDWTKCNGLQDLAEYPDTQKSVPVREEECILCMACVTSCPTEAITVEE